jgi:galactonate dehydratase
MSNAVIRDIRAHVVAVAPGINWIFVKVETSDGLHGWGEATLEGKDRTALGAIEDLARSLVGAPVPHPVQAWQRHFRNAAWKGAALFTAMSAIDHALWDLLGKRLEAPVHELLGGPIRDQLHVYTWAGAEHDGALLAAEVERAHQQYGFTHFKVAPLSTSYTLDRKALRVAVDELEAVAAKLPAEGKLAVEGHGRLLPAAAVELARAVAHLPVMFLEDLVNTDDDAALRLLRERTDLPLAAGEKRYTRSHAWPLIRDGLVDYLLVDLCHAGGITEVMRICAAAEPAGISVVPHNPNGPIGMAATLQVAAASPVVLAAESVHARFPLLERLTGSPILVEDGHISVPDGPGLGVELDEDALVAMAGTPADFPFPEDVSVPRGRL